MIVMLALSGCRGVGFSKFDTTNFWKSGYSEESEANKKFWDRYYGRKGGGFESTAWKDFYGQPAEEIPKYEHCGFWGNCGGAAKAAPAQSDCAFYGTCTKTSSGW